MENKKITKQYFQSDTVRGLTTALFGTIINLFNLPILPDEVQLYVGAIFTLAGLLYALYGRIKTKGEKLIY